MSKASPTQRSLTLLRKRGMVADVAERRLPHTFRTHDLFNAFDIIAVGNGRIVAVQTTTRSNQASRLAKVVAEPAVRAWLECGGGVYIHGWAKVGRPQRWTCNEREVTVADFDAAAHQQAQASTSEAAADKSA